jgi:hypothetical protein
MAFVAETWCVKNSQNKGLKKSVLWLTDPLIIHSFIQNLFLFMSGNSWQYSSTYKKKNFWPLFDPS